VSGSVVTVLCLPFLYSIVKNLFPEIKSVTYCLYLIVLYNFKLITNDICINNNATIVMSPVIDLFSFLQFDQGKYVGV
jgi:predicted tellurium resistance membrane protein TerC